MYKDSNKNWVVFKPAALKGFEKNLDDINTTLWLLIGLVVSIIIFIFLKISLLTASVGIFLNIGMSIYNLYKASKRLRVKMFILESHVEATIKVTVPNMEYRPNGAIILKEEREII